MTSRTIRAGATQTLYQISPLTGTLTIQGGLNGGPGGVGIIASTGVLTNRGDIRVLGGDAGPSGATASNQGASLEIYGTLSNHGSINLLGGTAGLSGALGTGPGGLGALLNVAGALSNAGTIEVNSGAPGTNGGQGATFQIEGSLANTGLLAAWGGTGAPNPSGAGAVLNTGTLLNRGTIHLHSGSLPDTYYEPGGPAATFTNGGSLTNQGTILLDGGSGIPSFNGAQGAPGAHGAVFNNSGVLTNAGSIQIGGGTGGVLYYGGFGATMTDSGTLTNTGLLTVDGSTGSAYPEGHESFLAATLAVSGSLANSGTLEILGGKPGIPTYGSYLNGPGGRVVDSGVVVNSGLIIIANATRYEASGTMTVTGVLSNSGTIAATNGAKAAATYPLSKIKLEGTGTIFLNEGTIGVSEISSYGGLVSGSGVISAEVSGGTVTASGGLLDLTGYFDTSLGVDAGGTLELSGINLFQESTVSLNPQGLLDLVGPFKYISHGSTYTSTGTANILINSPNGGVATLLGGGTVTLNPADSHLTVSLAQASTITLSKMGFVTAIGSPGNDTITALAAQQTLTGGAGTDTLIGANAAHDTFRDTAAGLNTDTIGNFVPTDEIDVTDLAPGAALSLTYAQGATQGTLTLAENGAATTITLLGSFTQSQFTTESDGHGGVLIGLHPAG